METPTTLIEAIQKFSDPQFAHDFLVSIRWPDGVTCPRCQGERVGFISTRSLFKCKDCKKQFSVKVGTIFEDSPLGLDKWLTAYWLVVNAKNGISSYELARSLGVKQETAWHMAHRIRFAIQAGTLEVMSGQVEADETVLGGQPKFMHEHKRLDHKDRGYPKIGVFGLRERGGKVSTMVVPNNKAETLQPIIRLQVEVGSDLYTDSWAAYDGLNAEYNRVEVNHYIGQYVKGEASTNGLEGYWNLLKRGYKGTYTHFCEWHAARYLAEEDFRYNTRKQTDGERFADALTSIVGKRLTYEDLTESHLVHLDRG